MTKPTESDGLRFLFVDDEPKVIRGLVRNMSMIADDWEARLATSGEEGLAVLRSERIDVVVSDLRMPAMDGAQFLAQARALAPDALRFVLSGYAKGDLMLKATGLAHRYLAKPCNTRDIVEAVVQVRNTQRMLRNPEVVRYVNETTELHADNKPLQEILRATQDLGSSLRLVGDIIQRNPTVHVAVLRMANTAFFGGGGSVDTIEEALQVLGLEIVRGLAILEMSKSRLALPPPLAEIMDAILEHSVACAAAARRMRSIAKEAKLLQCLASAALLHDLGKIVLLARKGPEYARLLERSVAEDVPLWKLERAAFGCDHAAIGGYLLQLWGLPEAIVRSVAGHHLLNGMLGRELCPLALLHLANAACHLRSPSKRYRGGALDGRVLEKFGIDPAFYADLD